MDSGELLHNHMWRDRIRGKIQSSIFKIFINFEKHDIIFDGPFEHITRFIFA